jgi:hypothetical protein
MDIAQSNTGVTEEERPSQAIMDVATDADKRQ